MQVQSERRRARASAAGPTEEPLGLLLNALRAVEQGDFSVRLPELLGSGGDGAAGVLDDIARTFNSVVGLNETLTRELVRVENVVAARGA